MTFIPAVYTFVIATFSAILNLHPIHVSVTDIEYAQKEKILKITMRMYADDLETTFREQFKQPDLDIIAADKESVNKMGDAYIKKHFKVSLDGKVQTLNYLGHEQEEGAFLFYVEAINVKKWKTISVVNDMFTEMFEEQSNLVHVNVNDEIKSLRLMRDTPSGNITF
jgi:hypothetical protein